MTTYERPTEDLRQVKERDGAFEYTTIQRKWLVQDGEPREVPYYQYLGPDEAEWPLPSSSCTITLTDEQQALLKQGVMVTGTVSYQPSTKSIVNLKEEWRDLPVVDRKDA